MKPCKRFQTFATKYDNCSSIMPISPTSVMAWHLTSVTIDIGETLSTKIPSEDARMFEDRTVNLSDFHVR